MLLDILSELSPSFFLSKAFTIPVLLFIAYKILYTPPNVKPKLQESTPSVPVESDYGAIGVPIEAESNDFNWKTREPFKYRPFKAGLYKLVMGIHNIKPSEWFLIENTYMMNTDLKIKYGEDPERAKHMVFLADNAVEATIEFYEMTVQFLLERYPMYFEKRGHDLFNKIRNESIPLDPHKVKDPNQLNYYLLRNIEEDFVILFQDPENYGTDEYIFKSGVFAYAQGFDPAKRAYKPLSAVHEPVPEYREKLRPQMNKFFDRFKPFNYVRRNNWSIQTHNKLGNIDIVKGVEGQELNAIDPDTLDYKREVFFRTERQILTRLPKSNAIVFTIRTYLTSMSDIRDELLSGELIGGIEGMQETIGQYKKRPEWGEAVIKYLKNETDGIEKPWIEGFQ